MASYVSSVPSKACGWRKVEGEWTIRTMTMKKLRPALRLEERKLVFNVLQLKHVAAKSVGRADKKVVDNRQNLSW